MNLNDFNKQRAEEYNKAKAIHESAKADNRDMSEGEVAEFNARMDKVAKLDETIAREGRLSVIESSLKESQGRISKPEIAKVHEDEHRFSLNKAIDSFLENGRLTGLEKEVSDEIYHKTGKAPKGFYVPNSLQYANLDTSTGSGGLASTTDFGNFIELLRSSSLMGQLGATMLNDLVGTISIPKQTGTATAYWINANGSGSVTPTAQSIGQVPLAPNTVGASTKFTRAFFKQTGIDPENFIRNDLISLLGIEIDRAAFNGSGSGSEPEGILQNSDVTTVSLGTNGGAPTWAKVVELESTTMAANAPTGKAAYVTTPAGMGKLKTTVKVSGQANFLYQDSLMNETAVYASNQVPANLTKGVVGSGQQTDLSAMIYGRNWADVLIASWGGFDVVVNPYTDDTYGMVKITIMKDVDIALRHPESFTKIIDMVTT